MKILLVCNAGMSTGILQMKLEEEAKKRGMDASVEAIPMGELELMDNMAEADMILLGPQIRFALNDVKKLAKGAPVMVIDVSDFGMMRADRVFDKVLENL